MLKKKNNIISKKLKDSPSPIQHKTNIYKLVNNSLRRDFQFIMSHRTQLFFVMLFLFFIFLRSYQLFERAYLGWDQVDSAWAAKNIIVNKQFIINGPVAKGNTGIYMGPLYFYLIAIFYFFTNLDPIASPIFQIFMNILNFLVLFIVTKKLFGTRVAFVAGFINTVCLSILNADRIQSGFYLIVPVSYLIFYSLYRVVTGNPKSIPLLALFTGLSFHVDFTSVFYPVLIFLSTPFFLKSKKALKYSLFSLPLFLLFFIPTLVVDLSLKHSTVGSVQTLFSVYYHGFHLTRFLQIFYDAFISVQQVLQFPFLRPFVFFVFPIFFIVYYFQHPGKKTLLLFFLILLWILVPWIILTTYSGELSDYYFSLPKDLVIAALSYLTVFFFQRRFLILGVIPIVFWTLYTMYSFHFFFMDNPGNLLNIESQVRQIVMQGNKVEYTDHNLESYVFYVYLRNASQNKR